MSSGTTGLVLYDGLAHYLFDSIEEMREFATRRLWSCNCDRPNMALGGIIRKQKLAMIVSSLPSARFVTAGWIPRILPFEISPACAAKAGAGIFSAPAFRLRRNVVLMEINNRRASGQVDGVGDDSGGVSNCYIKAMYLSVACRMDQYYVLGNTGSTADSSGDMMDMPSRFPGNALAAHNTFTLLVKPYANQLLASGNGIKPLAFSSPAWGQIATKNACVSFHHISPH